MVSNVLKQILFFSPAFRVVPNSRVLSRCHQGSLLYKGFPKAPDAVLCAQSCTQALRGLLAKIRRNMGASQMGQWLRIHLPMQEMQETETQVRSLGWENPLEEEMATHSSILAWKIPWTEEHGGLQSMGLQRVRHD